LGAKRLVFISETEQAGHDKKVKYLKEAGYELVADEAAALSGTDAYCIPPPQLWDDLAIRLNDDRAQAYFISCDIVHAIEVIERLESELNRPVVTSNQAALWCALRTLGLKDVVPGLGALFSHGLAKAAA